MPLYLSVFNPKLQKMNIIFPNVSLQDSTITEKYVHKWILIPFSYSNSWRIRVQIVQNHMRAVLIQVVKLYKTFHSICDLVNVERSKGFGWYTLAFPNSKHGLNRYYSLLQFREVCGAQDNMHVPSSWFSLYILIFCLLRECSYENLNTLKEIAQQWLFNI